MVPIALVHERDAEGAFNGLAKIRELIRQKAPLRRVLDFLMNTVLTNKFNKQSRGSRYNASGTIPWKNIDVCMACRMEEDDEISALTLLQVCDMTMCFDIAKHFILMTRQWRGLNQCWSSKKI